MTVIEFRQSKALDQGECWMFFFPGSSIPGAEATIREAKPAEEFPSVDAAKATFFNRINGRDPKYARVDDDAFAWIYFKKSQQSTPQSPRWSRYASVDLTLKIGATVGDLRRFTVETRAETERRLEPLLKAIMRERRDEAEKKC